MPNRDEILRRYSEEIINSTQHMDNNDGSHDNENVDEKIDSINEKLIENEENQKIKLREKLNKSVIKFIWIQLIFFNLIVLVIVLSVTSNFGIFKEIEKEVAILLFEFLKYYISVTVVELLGMLGFILKFVFSRYNKR